MSIHQIATETAPGVFHLKDWGTQISQSILNELMEHAQKNINHKARLCLHPTPKEILQVTYLAFFRPYKDKIHKHPDFITVIKPIFGEAKFSTFGDNGLLLSTTWISGTSFLTISTPINTWHSIEVESETFTMLEIGLGPFSENSTINMVYNPD
jgi:cupin fold WbuC family metalloprotein